MKGGGNSGYAGGVRRPFASPALTLTLLTLGYAGFYFCRANFSVAKPQLIEYLSLHGGLSAADAKITLGTVASTATLAYALAMRRGNEPRHLGHNPLGAWMILALLAAAMLAATSGAVYVTDAYWGDAAVYRLHQIAGWSLVWLVPLHLAGVALTSWLQRENLVKAMLTGNKRAATPGHVG